MEREIKFKRVKDKTFTFRRVNILLGANGTGKSTLLRELRDNARNNFVDKNLIYVEGGRTIELTNSLALSRDNFLKFNTVDKAQKTYNGKKTQSLSTRVIDALMLLDRIGQQIKENHSDAVHHWHTSGGNTPAPHREEPPLTKLFILFSEIFPGIELTLDPDNKILTCKKNNGSPYNPQTLSDGEKQVLSILADIALLADENSIVLVDEPELNLNPSLAVRVWETIENDLPNCQFIYTTHNVGFSMRSNVDSVFVLSNMNENITEIKNIADIHGNDLRQLLGSIPAILSTNKALITEGDESSFDTIFYRWIINISQIEIVPMGGCSDVIAVANRTGIWQAIAPTVKLIGIFDRDYKHQSEIDSLTSINCKALYLHEAESYLCLPEIVIQVAKELGLVQHIPTEDEIKQLIKSELEATKLFVVAQRVFKRTHIKLEVSIKKNELKQIEDDATLEAKLIEESKIQTEFAEENLGEDRIKEILKEEISICQTAIDSNSAEEMLKYVPGKRVFSKIFPLTGARTPSDYARSCVKHIKIDDILVLKILKKQLSFD